MIEPNVYRRKRFPSLLRVLFVERKPVVHKNAESVVEEFMEICGHISNGDGNDEMGIICVPLCFKTELAVKSKIDSNFNLEIRAKRKN